MNHSGVVLPIVHLNGTSREQLMEERLNARDALQEALRALCRAAPNGRD